VAASVNKYSTRSPRSRTAGVLHVLQGQYCILTMPHLIGQLQLKTIFKVANSSVFPNVRAALISVHATLFNSVI
jgi:hypothetical protein